MPITIAYEPAHRLLISHPSGAVTFTEVITAWQKIAARSDIAGPVNIIVDHRAVQGYDIGFTQMQQIASLLGGIVRRGDPPGRIAHLAPVDLGFGMGRMFELIATARSPLKVAVFRDLDELAAWLGGDPATLGALLGSAPD